MKKNQLQISLIEKASSPRQGNSSKRGGEVSRFALLMPPQICTNLVPRVSYPFFDKKMSSFRQKSEDLGTRFK